MVSLTPTPDTPLYGARTIKRRRATRSEMAAREAFLIDYAVAHGPITVRGLYYQAEVAGIPGIGKSEGAYRKVQTQVLQLRREGRLPYDKIADATRMMRKPRTFDGWMEALEETARLYRKNLWAGTGLEVEIWVEKSALAGVLYPVTARFDVPLMCTGGFSSETFAHEAVARLRGSGCRLIVYSLYDFDRAGRDAARSLREKIVRFGAEYGVAVDFRPLALTMDQLEALALPTRPPKRTSTADRRWPYPVAAELDAIPPETLRDMVRAAIEVHLPRHELEHLDRIEAAERETLMNLIRAIQ